MREILTKNSIIVVIISIVVTGTGFEASAVGYGADAFSKIIALLGLVDNENKAASFRVPLKPFTNSRMAALSLNTISYEMSVVADLYNDDKTSESIKEDALTLLNQGVKYGAEVYSSYFFGQWLRSLKIGGEAIEGEEILSLFSDQDKAPKWLSDEDYQVLKGQLTESRGAVLFRVIISGQSFAGFVYLDQKDFDGLKYKHFDGKSPAKKLLYKYIYIRNQFYKLESSESGKLFHVKAGDIKGLGLSNLIDRRNQSRQRLIEDGHYKCVYKINGFCLGLIPR